MDLSRDRILLIALAALLMLGLAGFLYLNDGDGGDDFRHSDRAPDIGARPSRDDGSSRATKGSGGGNAEAADPDVVFKEFRAGIHGVVKNREGELLEGALVALCVDLTDLRGAGRQGGVLRHVDTGPEGAFSFTELSEIRTYILRVECPGYAGKFIPGLDLEPGEGKELEVILHEGFEVFGQVTDLGGNPIENARIDVRDLIARVSDPRLSVERRTTTDKEGRFRVEHVSGGFKDIVASADGFATVRRARAMINRASVERPFDFQLAPGAEIRGRVVDENDQGVAGVAIRAQCYDPMARRMGEVMPMIETDENGVFSYAGLREGDYVLVSEKRGWYCVNSRDYGRTSGPDVTIRMKRNPSIRGRVVDADTGAPVQRFSLYGTPRDSLMFVAEAAKQNFETVDGSFEFFSLRNSGDLFLNLDAPGYAGGQSSRIDLNAGDAQEVVIEAYRGATVTGRVVDLYGKPIAKADVAFKPVMVGENGLGELGRMIYGQARLLNKRVRTNEKGEFRAENLREGAYRIGASHPDFAETLGNEVFSFGRGGEQRVKDLQMSSGGTVVGVAYDNGGEVMKRVVIRLKSDDRSLAKAQSFQGTTDDEGRFRIAHVPAGPYRLEVIRTAALHQRTNGLPGLPSMKHIPVHVAEGATQTVEVRGL